MQIARKSRNELDWLLMDAAVHAQPEAVGAAGRFRYAVVDCPRSRRAARSSNRSTGGRPGVPVLLLRERLAGLVAKLARAVFAVADVVALQPAPTVVGEALRVAAFDDLAAGCPECIRRNTRLLTQVTYLSSARYGSPFCRGRTSRDGRGRNPRRRGSSPFAPARPGRLREQPWPVRRRGRARSGTRRGGAAGICSGSTRRCHPR